MNYLRVRGNKDELSQFTEVQAIRTQMERI
jgi:hypothetical protein